jgi:hypothetical protein
MDADDYAAGQVEKRMKEFQCGPRQVVVGTAGAAAGPGAAGAERSAVGGAGWDDPFGGPAGEGGDHAEVAVEGAPSAG